MLVDISRAIDGYFHQIFIQTIDGWVILGILGQIFFTARFLTQWIASERAGRSVVPLSFWFFSIGGGLMLLAYALYRRDPVFILGQAFGLFIYVRNLMLIRKSKGENK